MSFIDANLILFLLNCSFINLRRLDSSCILERGFAIPKILNVKPVFVKAEIPIKAAGSKMFGFSLLILSQQFDSINSTLFISTLWSTETKTSNL